MGESAGAVSPASLPAAWPLAPCSLFSRLTPVCSPRLAAAPCWNPNFPGLENKATQKAVRRSWRRAGYLSAEHALPKLAAALLFLKLSCRPEPLPKRDSCLEFLCAANEGISFLSHFNSFLFPHFLPKAVLTCPCVQIL